MKNLTHSIALLFFSNFLIGQTPNISYSNATAAVQYLLGQNVVVSNITFSGDSRQLAIFTNGEPKLDYPTGIALTTGNANFAATPQTGNAGDQDPVNSNNYDIDLDQLTGNVKSAAVLEFDFSTTGDNINFNCTFASEEYPTYVGSEYNDAFGFFLSGPGISGSFSNNGVNIATLPNGSPISINTVNAFMNSSYFFFGSNDFAYNGQTVPIAISHAVQCNQTYHLKIAICNVQDNIYDSGLFLSKSSLNSFFNLGQPYANVSPVCAGDEIVLTVAGSSDWTYEWSDGQTGEGLNQISTTANLNTSAYVVTATNSSGCAISRNVDVLVSSPNNIAPWMDGINGTGEYTYYVSAGDLVSFTSTLFNDNVSEVIDITVSNSIPSNFSATEPSTSGGTFSFAWQTNQYTTPTGTYTYTLNADDRNACIPGIDTFVFTIIVVCDQCPVCVNYENRTPSGTPLPSETRAGQCITAGFSQTVSTGTAPVLFQAGETIDLGVLFDAGPNFEAVLDPVTCIADCEDCCDDWAGFTYDELPNPFYMNFSDDDPTNDFIQVTDTYHPFCAFDAKEFEFLILDGAGNLMNNGLTGISNSFCCGFESPAPENPIAHSSIWWNGYTNNIFGNQVRPNDGVYFYKLTLKSCNGQTIVKQGYISIGGVGPSGIAANNGEDSSTVPLSMQFASSQEQEFSELLNLHEQLEKKVELNPNPTNVVVRIAGIQEVMIYYQIFDEKGVLLTRKLLAEDGQFSMSAFSSGVYYVKVFNGSDYVVRRLVKL